MPIKQLTIFDDRIGQIRAKIADLQAKIKSERETLEKLDPKDCEDRNDILTSERYIRDYAAEIENLQKELASHLYFSGQNQR
ncbi:MAG: hypothetical protein KBT14_02450 [Proteobacteria bacterium]|nr:hypothetical protein [Candidatus Enterousia onthequi]